MIAAIAVALVAAAVWYVLAPLRRGEAPAGGGESAERARLVRERESALRALRDLALDHATGKMSDADYEELRLRYEAAAIDVLRRLDAVESRRPFSAGARPAG